MGCACKAGQYIRNTKRYFDGKPERKTNLSLKTLMKVFFKAVLVILVVIFSIPFIVIYAILRKFVFKEKAFNLLNMIKVKI